MKYLFVSIISFALGITVVSLWSEHSFVAKKEFTSENILPSIPNESSKVDLVEQKLTAPQSEASEDDSIDDPELKDENYNDALKTGDRVALVGFGSFSVAERKKRTGRNPQTGATIKIRAKNVVKFKAGSDLGSAVN